MHHGYEASDYQYDQTSERYGPRQFEKNRSKRLCFRLGYRCHHMQDVCLQATVIPCFFHCDMEGFFLSWDHVEPTLEPSLPRPNCFLSTNPSNVVSSKECDKRVVGVQLKASSILEAFRGRPSRFWINYLRRPWQIARNLYPYNTLPIAHSAHAVTHSWRTSGSSG